mgnify:CR=1 FL=1
MSIIIYTTKTCPICHDLIAEMDRHGVSYVEHDLEDPENIVYLRCDAGVFSVQAPIIYDGDKWIGGEDTEGIKRFRETILKRPKKID